MNTRTFKIASWSVTPPLNRLSRNGVETEIEPKAMDLLVFLAEHAGEVLSTEELIAAVWKGRVVGDHAVYRLIQQLRRALGDDSSNPSYIATVPRRGYRLIAPVESVEEPPQSEGRFYPALRPIRVNLPVSSLAIVAVLAVLLAAVVYLSRPPSERPGAFEPQTIAVLPLINLSEDERHDYLGEGIAGEIIHALSNGSGLRVVARTSAFAFQDSELLVADIAERLGASLVLEGTVRRENDRLRVISQLVDATSGEQLWSRDFDRYIDDLISLEREIALDITAEVAGESADAARVAAALPLGRDISAYEYYLLGRQRMHVPNGIYSEWSYADADQAVAYFRNAIAADPELARAYTGLADAMLARAMIGRGIYRPAPLPPAEAEEILSAIARAEELAPGLAETRVTRGLALRVLEGEHDRAYDLYREAIEINPNLVDAYLNLARGVQGEEGVAALEAAVLLDPMSPEIHVWLVRILRDLYRFEEANVYLERGLRLEEIPRSLLTIHAFNLASIGELAAAVAELERLLARREGQEEAARLHTTLGQISVDLEDLERAEASRHALETLDGGSWVAIWLALARNEFANAAALVHRRDPNQISGLFEMLIGHDHHARELIHGDDIDGNQLSDFVTWGWHPAVNDAYLRLRQGDGATAAELLDAARQDVAMAIADRFLAGGAFYVEASINALENDPEAALASLEAAIESGWRRAWYAEIDPNLATLRDEPRFRALVTEVRADLARQRASL